MNEIFPNIYQIFPSKQTPSKYRSFFVKRDEGNLLIPCFSTNSTIEAHFDAIAELGGLSRQLLGDSHFKSSHCDQVAERFNAPVYCSEGEAPDVTPVVKQVMIFPFTRHLLEPQIEVIPTPGHRPGGVCYLISMLEKQYQDFRSRIYPTPKSPPHCMERGLQDAFFSPSPSIGEGAGG